MADKSVCKIDGCGKAARARGWCFMHYMRWRRWGDVSGKKKKRANPCSIERCGNLACNSRGWCSAHYQRWRKHGTPLGGGQTRGYAQDYFRDVVLACEGDECLIWPYWKDENGRGKVRWGGRDQIVSRLLCEIANGPAPTSEHHAAHNCGNGHLACCTRRHLEWKTPLENAADRVVHGTQTRGEDHSVAKLTEKQVREILALKGRKHQREIADQFGIGQSYVSQIHNGYRWGWIE